MIPHEEFGRLRLRSFLPADQVVALQDWRFLDLDWIGEAHGFSEWLRLRDDPEVLRSLSISFAQLPAAATRRMLAALELPIAPGLDSAALDRLFGPPWRVERFVGDRSSRGYLTQGPHRYNLDCTLLDVGGLTYIVVTVPPIDCPVPIP